MRITCLAILFLTSLPLGAQTIRAVGFQKISLSGMAPDVRAAVYDPDGRPCAVLRLQTEMTGLTFEAGLAGIMDVRYEKGAVWLYVPASARTLSVAHPEYGVLRAWPFPESLEPGGFYAMKLEKAPAPRTKPTKQSSYTYRETYQPVAAVKPTGTVAANPEKEKTFCSHFVDFYAGFGIPTDLGELYVDDFWFGLSYTWMGKKAGPYVSVAWCTLDCWSLVGGASVRLTDPERTGLDLQLYGGVGAFDRKLGFDLGTRFAWKSDISLSKWDFAVGCQYYDRQIIPTVSVGCFIWGIPVCISLCVVGLAILY